MPLEALIFDVDGTLAETEECHREAFNQAFSEAGLDWVWEQPMYRRLLKTTGGKERMIAYADLQGEEHPDVVALHARKTEIYNENILTGNVPLRPGIERLISQAHSKGLRLAIATTTSLPNVHSLLEVNLGKESIGWFEAICTAEDVSRKKPDPEVFEIALERLGLPAENCLAFEDSWNGVQSAKEAGIPTLVTPSVYTNDQDFRGVLSVVSVIGDATEQSIPISGHDFGAAEISLRDLAAQFS